VYLLHAKKYREAVEAVNRALQIDADSSDLKNARGLCLLSLGEIDAARESCETPKRGWQGMLCLAVL
jgi:Flp pilus assembly protein TadD